MLNKFSIALVLTLIFFSPVLAQVIPQATKDTITFSSSAGCSTSITGINLQIPVDTNVMGFKFDILFPSDTFRVDTSSITESTLLTTGAGGSETYAFILDDDSASVLPQGRLTVIGVRMQSDTANKGLSSALYGLLSNLRFQKINADTLFAGRDTNVSNKDTIYVTNFVFRDKNNDTVVTSQAQISLRLFLLLLRRGSDFNDDGSANANDLVDFARVFQGLQLLGSWLDYGSPGDAGNIYENRIPDSDLTAEDLIIFARYFQGLEF